MSLFIFICIHLHVLFYLDNYHVQHSTDSILQRAATFTAQASEQRLGRTALTLATAGHSVESKLKANLKAAHKKKQLDKVQSSRTTPGPVNAKATLKPYNIIAKLAVYPTNKDRGCVEVEFFLCYISIHDTQFVLDQANQ